MKVSIVEVGPRDGFQSIGPWIATERKLSMIRALLETGLRRIEIGSFVSPKAIPQLSDTPLVLKASQSWPGLDAQVLVATARRAEEALIAGCRHLSFVLSVSKTHNQSNVRRDPAASVEDYAAIVGMMPAGTAMRLNLATAFDCPFDGRVKMDETLALLAELVPIFPDAEIALCDTTGRVTPDHVEALFAAAETRFPGLRWNFRGHDTYGLGVANVLAALRASVRSIDAAVGGLGGCPYAPGATGNVATEDVVWTLHRMGIETGIDLGRLLPVAEEAAALPGAQSGGRARLAMAATACRATGAASGKPA